ncbi:increased rDNA silencing protein 4 [Colletotrichum graminicola]|uniref:Increased rDNA silencing protein 4 n=1 Tax=Colletotrichum graminicola (strain M1.001 / M2 / FGSC 10212) TaxID=645133 RepID=E3Q209_COLGM|nr:increased rDNA silencing protein 4 [Colletotrichum graminicola M1.001]EFQ25110.1 increased rDNA silencing protein 4 [Colletotrichum graminicola M1.001]WDK15282.1 increased rDNA silencing protein 4 [Colletotrichum graminicola]
MMSAHHNHPSSSSSAAARGASDAAAALKGANLAFNKSKPKPIPPPKPTPGRRRGTSLIAASAASAHDRSTSASPVQRQHTGTSLATTPDDRDRFGRDGTADMRDRMSNFLASSPAAATSTPSHLTPHTRLDPKSPSYIAATLAASRSASPSPQLHASPSSLTPAQLNQLHQMQNARLAGAKMGRRGSAGSSSVVSSLDLPDTSSIPATRHLLAMFERVSDDVDPVKRSGGDSARSQVRPLTPDRDLSPSRAKASRMGIVEEETEGAGAQRPMVPKPKLRPVTPVTVDGLEPIEEVTPQAKGPAPKPVKPVKPLLSPARISPKRSEPEQLPPAIKTQPAVATTPMSLEVPEVRSKSQLTRVPITQTTSPESKPLPPATPEPRWSRPKAQQTAPSSPPVIKRADTEVVSPKPTRPASRAKLRPPTPPQPRGTGGKPREADAPPLNEPRSIASIYGNGPLQEPFRRSDREARPSTADTSSSNDTFVSAESGQTAVPHHAPLAVPSPRPVSSTQSTPGRSSANSSPSHTAPWRTPASSNTNLPLSALSNAIMAGSLAAARLTPSNTGNSAQQQQQRTRSPRLRQTLRRPPSKSDDEDEIRKRRHQRASNKHSHREGARRRWRDEITPRERRRYEAVWASNRGRLLLNPPGPSPLQPPTAAAPTDAGDCVVNVVAREIWRRSRLPAEELAEVWDLVDRGRRGMVGKAEFVVGMWLIDQRLRGRKIPARVSASVWDSALGVTVPSPPKGRK